MCGIAGVVGQDPRSLRERLLAMAAALVHRGPDGTGLYLDGDMGMVNTRLSIVDLAGGDQPIANEDGRLWVIQNGEIYNHPELRQELEAAGHRFRTACDTEVIVHAYEQWGEDCPTHFNGPFAFAVWDRQRERLFLARDRFGVRPLFLANLGDTLLFASEIKALLTHPGLPRRLDPGCLTDLFTLWVTLPDRSAFQGVRELGPGCSLVVERSGRARERRWWELPFTAAPSRDAGEGALAEELRELLLDAVRLRLRADVPVGAYLSGGLDSSATAAAVRRVSSCHLRTFAVRFEDPRFDEGPHQEQMAAALATELTSVRVGAADIAALFPEVVRLAEQPLLRTAPAPLLALSRHVRQCGFKVVLTGEGADEVFAGYDIFREDKLRRFWARQPRSTCRPALFGRIHPYLQRGLARTGGFAAAFFARHLEETDHPLYSHRIRFANTARILGLLEPAVLEAARAGGDPEERLLGRLPPGFLRASPLKRAQLLETITFLQGYLLHAQGDRMLMGSAVEGRFPFLDHRLAAFAAAVPDRLLLKGLREKHLLREAVAPWLPREIGRRPKHPYRAPILHAFVGPAAPEYCAALLDPARIAAAGVFAAPAVERLVAKCRGALERGVSETDEMALVAVLSTMLLHEQLIARSPAPGRVEPVREVSGAEVVAGARGGSEERS